MNHNARNDDAHVEEERDSNSNNDELSNIDNHSSTRVCLHCLQKVEGSSRCSQCRTALYCNRDCQLQHWPVHKNICEDSNAENSNERLKMKAMNYSNQGNCIYIHQSLSLII